MSTVIILLLPFKNKSNVGVVPEESSEEYFRGIETEDSHKYREISPSQLAWHWRQRWGIVTKLWADTE